MPQCAGQVSGGGWQLLWLRQLPQNEPIKVAQFFNVHLNQPIVRFLGTVRLLAVVFVQGHRPRDALGKKRGRLIGF